MFNHQRAAGSICSLSPSRKRERTEIVAPSSTLILKALALPRGRSRRGRRGGRASRISQLQRLQRIDEAGAETVVAVTRREPFGAQGEDAANVGRRQLGLRSSNSATMPLTSAAATEVPVVI
jgi:hypothetical protein